MFWAGFGAVTFVIWLVIYRRTKAKKRERREAFLDHFNPQELRMNRLNKSVVYHVIGGKDGRLRVKVVWSDADPVNDGKVYMVKEDEVAPFDRSAFVSGW